MAAIPTRLFDVRNGNNAADADTTPYPAATLVVFRDAPAKNKIVQSFCDAYGYSATLPDGSPNPQSKQEFYNARLTDFIKDVHRGIIIKAATGQAAKSAQDAADSELPTFR